MARKVMAVLSGLALGACSVVGVRDGTEEPAYSVLQRIGEVELRSYGVRLAAETVLEGAERDALSAGFRRLAAYIFGDNQSRAKIAMTAPVAQARETIAMTAPVAQARDAQGRTIVRFFMPQGSTLATLPTPNDRQIALVELPPQRFAVRRFTGFAGPDAVAEERQRLLAAVKSANLTMIGEPVNWFYDPPWTIPFLRRNEVAVEVEAR